MQLTRIILIMAAGVIISAGPQLIMAESNANNTPLNATTQEPSEAPKEQNTPSLANLFKSGSTQEVEKALDLGVDINQADADGLTPLMLAAGFNPEKEIITLLVKRGAKVGAQEKHYGLTPLIFASIGNLPAVTHELLKAGADPNQTDNHGGTALYHAAAHAINPGSLYILIEAKADPELADTNGLTPLMQAASAGKLLTLEALLLGKAKVETTNKQGQTALIVAASQNDNPKILERLIKSGAKLEARDKNGLTPFLSASANNPTMEILETLKKAGADPKAVDNTGADALLLASLSNSNPKIINYILTTGAKVNGTRGNSMTPLLAAAGNPEPDVTRLLILNGANIEAKGPQGKTALMLAAALNPNDEVVMTLAGAGSDPQIKDDTGRSTLDYLSDERANLKKFFLTRNSKPGAPPKPIPK